MNSEPPWLDQHEEFVFKITVHGCITQLQCFCVSERRLRVFQMLKCWWNSAFIQSYNSSSYLQSFKGTFIYTQALCPLFISMNSLKDGICWSESCNSMKWILKTLLTVPIPEQGYIPILTYEVSRHKKVGNVWLHLYMWTNMFFWCSTLTSLELSIVGTFHFHEFQQSSTSLTSERAFVS